MDYLILNGDLSPNGLIQKFFDCGCARQIGAGALKKIFNYYGSSYIGQEMAQTFWFIFWL